MHKISPESIRVIDRLSVVLDSLCALEEAGASKRKSSAYQIYMKSALVDLKTTNPTITHKERFKLAASQWKTDPSCIFAPKKTPTNTLTFWATYTSPIWDLPTQQICLDWVASFREGIPTISAFKTLYKFLKTVACVK
ncbi:hypothetical protein CROQUDRAFT_88208 [Cronartium quercuum f. sp. fusiforme G11]|uniref:YABBY protein C-terminal domain-containing protein n=1 Tax=Cronartium quercuum f. sp. fusiforme G11 TaxID=708437 RepID=A0A9P6NN27_9BASI|nr:hypothetical protein CROQUDRAFT_88208 [Cronartium quercuum f. sp. fusiforme G11]